jgi:outer membrane receptor protein involved in Fe transport
MGNLIIQPQGNKLNDRDRFGYRAELLFAPADDFSARVTVDYDEFDEICCVIGSTAYGAGNQITALLGGKVVPNDPFTQSSFFNFDPTSKGENGGISLHIEKNFTNTTLESITSYRTSDNYEVQDIDFDAADVIAPSPISKDLSGVTQEIRWYTEDNEKVNWLVGGFYYQEDMDFNESVYFGTMWRTYIDAFLPGAIAGVAEAFGIPNSLLFAAGQGNTETATQDNSTISLFAQVDIQLNEKLNAILGVSYMEDEKEVSYNQINNAVFSNLDFVGAGTLGLIAAGFPPAQAAVLAKDPAYNPLIPLQALQFIPKFVDIP